MTNLLLLAALAQAAPPTFPAAQLQPGHTYRMRNGDICTVHDIRNATAWYRCSSTLFGWTDLGWPLEDFARAVERDITPEGQSR